MQASYEYSRLERVTVKLGEGDLEEAIIAHVTQKMPQVMNRGRVAVELYEEWDDKTEQGNVVGLVVVTIEEKEES